MNIEKLLRRQAGQQVLLSVKPGAGGEVRKTVAVPIDAAAAANFRYHEWEYTRRKTVDKLGKNQIGYVHLRAMTVGDFGDFAGGSIPSSPGKD